MVRRWARQCFPRVFGQERAHASAVLTVPTAIAPRARPGPGRWLVDMQLALDFYVTYPSPATIVFALLVPARAHPAGGGDGSTMWGFLSSGVDSRWSSMPFRRRLRMAGPRCRCSSAASLDWCFSPACRDRVGRPVPMLHLRLFGDRMFRNGSLAMFTAFGVLSACSSCCHCFCSNCGGCPRSTRA